MKCISRNATWNVISTLRANEYEVYSSADNDDDDDDIAATFHFQPGDELWLHGTVDAPDKLLREGVRLFIWCPQTECYTEMLLGSSYKQPLEVQ